MEQGRDRFMRLIFIRHGSAEDRNLGKEDRLRDLTQEGMAELRNNVKFLGLYLADFNPVILTSDLNRAVQTAGIIDKYGAYQGVFERPYLGTGDLAAFKTEAGKMADEVILLVGHNPYLEEWVYEITQRIVEFKKAGACEVEITNREDFSGKVNWYLDIGDYKKLIDQEMYEESFREFRQDMENKIEECRGEILKYREIYLAEPEEIESVHKLRVKIRQFRSLIAFFKPLMKKLRYREYQNQLRELAQQCAYLRELDVLKKDWASHYDEFSRNGLTGENFMKILETERSAEQGVLFSILEHPEYARRLNEIFEGIKSAIDLEKGKYLSLDEMVDDVLDAWHDEIEIGYDAIDENNLQIIHALRIKAKKMRYVMEVFGKDKEPSHALQYKEIKRWQEVLGDITDANRNSEAVNEIAQNHPEADIREEIALFNRIQNRNSEKLYADFFGKDKPEETAGAAGELVPQVASGPAQGDTPPGNDSPVENDSPSEADNGSEITSAFE